MTYYYFSIFPEITKIDQKYEFKFIMTDSRNREKQLLGK